MYVQYPIGTLSPNAVYSPPGTAGGPSSYTPPMAGAVGSGYMPQMQQMAPPQYVRGGQQLGGGLTQPLPVFSSQTPRDPGSTFTPTPGNAAPGPLANPGFAGAQYPSYDGLFPAVAAAPGKLDMYGAQPQDFGRGAHPPQQQQQPPCTGCGGCGGGRAGCGGCGACGACGCGGGSGCGCGSGCGNGCGGCPAAPPPGPNQWQAQACGQPAAPTPPPAGNGVPPSQAPMGNTAQPAEDPDDDDPNRLPTFVRVRGLPPDNDPRITRRPKAKKRAPGVCCA